MTRGSTAPDAGFGTTARLKVRDGDKNVHVVLADGAFVILSDGNKSRRDSMEIRHRLPDSTNFNRLFAFYYGFKLFGMLASLLPIYLGYRLFILGVTGQASLIVGSKSMSGQLLNAAPGLFFAVGGMIALMIAIWKGVAIQVGSGGDLAICNPSPTVKRRKTAPLP